MTAIDGSTHRKLFETPVGRTPRTLAIAPNGALWVVDEADATIKVLASGGGHLLGTRRLPPGSRPYGIAFAPNGAAAYVTLQETGEIVVLDPRDGALVARVPVGPTPRGIAITGDSSRVFVTRFVSPEDHGEVVEVDAATNSVVRTITLARDPGPDTPTSGRGVPNYLASIVISPDGRRAWIPSKKDNVERGVFRDGQALTFESTVRSIMSQLDLDAGAENLAARIDLDNRSLPSAVCFSPHGDVALVATLGSNTVDVLDAYRGDPITSLEDVGRGPIGVVLRPTAGELFVLADLSRTVSIYDLRSLLASRRTAPARVDVVSTVARERLTPTVLLGKQIFHDARDRRMSRDGYLSCASCHLDGDDDGRTWDFTDRGEGLRNTIALDGHGGMREGRVHWTGNFDEIQDFENDVRHAFRGEGFLADVQFERGTRSLPLGDSKAGLSPDLDALAAYVSSLSRTRRSPYRLPSGSSTPSALAGRATFTQLRCFTCHAGADFTDSAKGMTHDIGTIRPSSGRRLGRPLLGIDTPTLRGLWATAPYLHDGSAATLMDVLTTADPGGLHGNVGPLTDDDRANLVAYLLQIDDLESPAIDVIPAIVVTSNANGARVDEGGMVKIRALTVDGSDPVSSVEFYVDGDLLSVVAARPWIANWTATGGGEHEITARAIHASGVKTTADPARVDVGVNACRVGNVNAALGPIADVLFVNGSAGRGAERRIDVRPGDPVRVTMSPPPSAAGHATRFVLYFWAGEPTAFSQRALPGAVGTTCMPTPVSGGAPLPLFVANNLGQWCRLGRESWPQSPSRPAPSIVLDLPRGFGLTGQWFLQGIIHDPSSPQAHVAVTNGVVIASD
ncbi:MAG: hypothetical protein HYR85_11875 [Planctomycetes bacterium]|nr:hypothetical protein [Planctomycetota bacterium]